MVAIGMTNIIHSKTRSLFGVVLLPLILSGCSATTGGYLETSYTTTVSQLQEADRLYEGGQYQTALLKYSGYVFAPFPDKKNEDYALYKMALCQYQLGQFKDATKSVANLIRTYPNFQYMQQARDLALRCGEKIAEENQANSQLWNDLQKKIGDSERLLAQNPGSAEYQFQLANLYWDAGRYSDAVQRYERAAQLDRSYLEKKTLTERVRIDSNGQFHVRDPLLESLQKSSSVRVVDTRREDLKREDVLGNYEAVRVSGMVENTGLYDISNVQVEIAVYDFYNTIQETQVVSVGELRAGGRRPFSAVFSQFRKRASDITKYTTEVFYDEPVSTKP